MFARRSASLSAGGATHRLAVRHLNLHEYQSKDLMETHGVLVQKGRMAATAKEAGDVARWILKANPKAELIVKAQVRGIALLGAAGRKVAPTTHHPTARLRRGARPFPNHARRFTRAAAARASLRAASRAASRFVRRRRRSRQWRARCSAATS